MIEHENFDEDYQAELAQDFQLPESITEICVAHDGGRLTIRINGIQVFFANEGTRDCLVTLNSKPIPVEAQLDGPEESANQP